ncbi:MAG: hypothetical protein HYX75_14895 [Acidobacteria bacterium]|nr:hypothetical protein [Acidobacteriota bacterium]
MTKDKGAQPKVRDDALSASACALHLLHAVMLFLACAAVTFGSDFWEDRPYAEWDKDDCQRLISKSMQQHSPWKKDMGRAGRMSKGAVVWYSDTVWRAYYKFKGMSEEEMREAAKTCRPGLLLVLYYLEDPGGYASSSGPTLSPGALLGGTYLENGRGEAIRPSSRPASCLPFVDRYTIVFYFPIDADLTGFLGDAREVTFACESLGVRQTFDLDEMRVNGERDCYWRGAGGARPLPVPVQVAPRPRPRIQPLPFKLFPEKNR